MTSEFWCHLLMESVVDCELTQFWAWEMGCLAPNPRWNSTLLSEKQNPVRGQKRQALSLAVWKCSSFLCSHCMHVENTLRLWVLSVNRIAFWGLCGWRIVSGDFWSPGNFFLFSFNSSCRNPLSLKDDFDANVNAYFCFSLFPSLMLNWRWNKCLDSLLGLTCKNSVFIT